MKLKYYIDETILVSILDREYGIDVRDLTFIPRGTSAYSYTVNCMNGERYYLKLFDTTNERQRQGTLHLDIYLSMTWKMYHQGIFRNLTYPIRTKDGRYQTAWNHLILVLFHFVEGTMLRDSDSKQTLDKMAKLIADLHKTTPQIEEACDEFFVVSFLDDLLQNVSVLESATTWDDPVKKALQRLILQRKDEIVKAADLLRHLQSSVPAIQKERVLCHGDLWGGNIIIHDGEYYLIDWETSVIAPPERDLFYYLYAGKDFPFFFGKYETYMGKEVILHADLLRFYCYRTILYLLSSGISKILYQVRSEEDHQSSLDLISNRDLCRLHNMESIIRDAQKKLGNKIV